MRKIRDLLQLCWTFYLRPRIEPFWTKLHDLRRRFWEFIFGLPGGFFLGPLVGRIIGRIASIGRDLGEIGRRCWEFFRELRQGLWAFVKRHKAATTLLGMGFAFGHLWFSLYPWPPHFLHCSENDEKWTPDSANTRLDRINLGQCWTWEEQLEFYTTSQGSHIIEYDIIKNLETVDGQKLWTSKNFNRWGFIKLEADELRHEIVRDYIDKEIPGWPVGFSIDEVKNGQWKGRWLGPTCAACHTAQIEFEGKQLRIDGGPSMQDATRFMADLRESLLATIAKDQQGNPGEKFERYMERIGGEDLEGIKIKLEEDDRKKWDEIKVDSEKVRWWREKTFARLEDAAKVRVAWCTRNTPQAPRGGNMAQDTRCTQYNHQASQGGHSDLKHQHGFGRLDAFGIIFNEIIAQLSTNKAEPLLPTAPVSYPFLWDTSHHNWVQWNGALGPHTMGRNVGQAIGVFGQISHLPTVSDEPTSIRIRDQRQLQKLVNKLRSPRWPKSIFGEEDNKTKADAGKTLFENKCQGCHFNQDREKRLVNLNVVRSPIGQIGTDDMMAINVAQRRSGSSGELVRTSLEQTIKAVLGHGTSHPKETVLSVFEYFANCFRFHLQHAILKFEWKDLYKCVMGLFYGEEKEEKPLYRARPLDGIWATAPYLHNGSVANLYQLVLPSEKRWEGFCVGSREFDAKQVGFITTVKEHAGYVKFTGKESVKEKELKMGEAQRACEGSNRFWLDTTLLGNSKNGHEFRNEEGCMKFSKKGGQHGVLGCEITEEDRWAIIEYLKTR